MLWKIEKCSARVMQRYRRTISKRLIPKAEVRPAHQDLSQLPDAMQEAAFGVSMPSAFIGRYCRHRSVAATRHAQPTIAVSAECQSL